MAVREQLAAIASVIADEAERNKAFRHRLEKACSSLGIASPLLIEDRREQAGSDPRLEGSAPLKKGGRRSPSILDPIELARLSESVLRERLVALDLEQLKDVVAQHGMDPGKLVMKWKDPARIIDRITELSLARSTKGDAFKGAKPSVEPKSAAAPAEAPVDDPKT